MKFAVSKVATAFAGMAMLSGCAGITTREHRGYVMDEQLTTGIQVGVDNKQSVEKTLGLPTFTGTFEQNDWYYISRDTRAFAFRNPKVTDQTVLHVRFDQAGNVASVNQTDEKLIASIKPINDRTPTLGRERGFFDELFNNIGTIRQPGLPGSQGQ
jgi:outer membrane protein assembly factor BamE (lipoprotein component of BamABCDE complex)